MAGYQVHKAEKDSDGNVVRVKADPYVWLGSPNGTIILRGGQAWDAGWNVIPMEDLTDEHWERIGKLSVKVREEVGFPAKKPAPVKEPAKSSTSAKS